MEPDKKWKMHSIKFDEQLSNALHRFCDPKGISMSRIVRKATREFLQRQDKHVLILCDEVMPGNTDIVEPALDVDLKPMLRAGGKERRRAS